MKREKGFELGNRGLQAPGPNRREWRQDVVGVSGVVVLLGVWLVASPFVLDYQTGDASWNPIVCGTVAAVVALGQTFDRAGSSIPGLILIAIGAWLFASGFWLEASSQASWNAWGAGALMLFLGCVAAAATQRMGSA